MKCKKCRKNIPDGSKFCNHCGTPTEKKKLYRRPDGLYEKSMTINGKRKMFRGKTEKEVYQKIAAFSEEAEHGALFSALVTDWQDNYVITLQPSTAHGYVKATEAALDYFEGVYVKDIQPFHVVEYAQSLPRSFTKHTVSNYINVLSSIMGYAVRSRDYDIHYNPCHQLRLGIGKEGTERRYITPAEMRIVIDSAALPFGLFALFVMFSGCRRGEALALEWSDIDFERNVISISKSLSWEHSVPFVKKPKTRKGIREVVLLPALKRHLKPGKGLVFPNQNGEYMTESQYTRLWDDFYSQSGLQDYCEKNGLCKLTAHCMRHGYATILCWSKVDVKEAQRMLGHAKESTTRDIYTHVTEQSRKKNNDRLIKFVAGGFNKAIKKSS